VAADSPASDEVLGVVVTRGAVSGEAAELGGQLPFTGFDLASALMAAGMFLTVGGGARALSRRRAD
jgi:hypothetical protein